WQRVVGQAGVPGGPGDPAHLVAGRYGVAALDGAKRGDVEVDRLGQLPQAAHGQDPGVFDPRADRKAEVVTRGGARARTRFAFNTLSSLFSPLSSLLWRYRAVTRCRFRRYIGVTVTRGR